MELMRKLAFALDEFRQVRHSELFQRQKAPPRSFSERVDRIREARFLQLAG